MSPPSPSPLRQRVAEATLRATLGPRGWGLLTAEERQVERDRIASAFGSASPQPPVDQDREGWIGRIRDRGIRPVLPPSSSRCESCLTPAALKQGVCGGCRQLMTALGQHCSTLEFVTMAAKDDRPHDVVRWWKDAARGDTRVNEPHDLLTWPSVALSAHLEAHRTRLLIREPVITTVPTGAPLVDAALERARDLGWYAPSLTPTGTKHGEWSQRELPQSERLKRTAADWIINVDAVEGRPVLVLDDVFVTGATVFSYAAALRLAGATDVMAVVYERMVSGTRYYAALAAARNESGYRWSPDHVELARL